MLFRSLDPEDALGDHGASGDPDFDVLDNFQEWIAGTHPRMADTDGDGLLDGWEARHGLNPLNRSGVHSGSGDPDHDGLSNAAEQTHGTNPWNPDSDADLLSDAWEIAQGLDPTDPTGSHGADGDPDRDGLSNLHEYLAGTRPQDPASALSLNLELLSDGRLYLQFKTVAGRGYLLQTRTAIGDASWVTLMEVEPSVEDSTFQFISGVQNVRDRFYRLALKP